MKINYKIPIISSVMSIGIFFIICIILLYSIQPSYIMNISDTGIYKINIFLLLTYSLLFSITIGIVVLLCKTNIQSNNNITQHKMGFVTHDIRSYNPHYVKQ